jgi:plastocyanin
MLCDGMTLSARRLLALGVLAALAGAGTAQAVAATGAAEGRAARATGKTRAAAGKTRAPGSATARRAQKRAPHAARAVRLAGDVAWVPPAFLATTTPPLLGTAAPSGAAAGEGDSGASGGGTSGTGPGATTPPTTTTPTTPPPTQLQALGATVDERSGYTLVLSRTTLTAGPVVVQLINNGEDPHNLRIVRTSPSGGQPSDLPETPSRQQTSTTLTLSPGDYYLYCTLTQPKSHEAAGMRATIRVGP